MHGSHPIPTAECTLRKPHEHWMLCNADTRHVTKGEQPLSKQKNEEVWCMTTEMTPNVVFNFAPCLRARDYKDPPCVLILVSNDDDTE